MKKGKGKSKRSLESDIQEDLNNYFSTEDMKRQESVEKLKNFNFLPNIKVKNGKQKDLIKLIHENQIIFVNGPAGTGKTFITLKAALELLRDPNSSIKRIQITKPIIEAAESLGFLPGDMKEKINPYMNSFESTFNKLIGPGSTRYLIDSKVIDGTPLAFMRGDTFDNTVAILDEAQNTTKTGLKLFLSRVGETSKLIILGDSDQTDLKLKSHEVNALDDAYARFRGVPGVAFITFTEEDIVRSTILIELLKRYKD